ncbi:MAG: BlaI/MecI/CopY family transcriptional regulator [Rikenellaceae bacterium]
MEISKELTKTELDLMKVIWSIGKAFLSDIVNATPEPRPAYTTTSTILRILKAKGYVDYKKYGNIHQYYPTVSKEDYACFALKRMRAHFFGDSTTDMISFFIKNENISKSEKEEIVNSLNV